MRLLDGGNETEAKMRHKPSRSAQWAIWTGIVPCAETTGASPSFLCDCQGLTV